MAVKAEWEPGAIGRISLRAKSARERSAGNPHAAFDEAGAADGMTVMLVRHSHGKPGGTDGLTYRHCASPRPHRNSLALCERSVTMLAGIACD